MKLINRFMESWSGFHIHFPNTKVFKNETIIFGPKGEEYKSEQLFDLMVEKHIINGNYIKMAKYSWDKFVTKMPQEIDSSIPVHLFYNDGIPTRYQLNFTKGWNKLPEIIYNKGDGTIPAIGPKTICNTWKNVKWNGILANTKIESIKP